MNFLGIDIGTTTISAALTDNSGNSVFTATLPNNAQTDSFHLQDPCLILNAVQKLLKQFEEKYTFARIGLTGQMHGILYVDQNGLPCSQLYTWQDPSGNLPFEEGNLTYSQKLTQLTGLTVPSGYGLCTLFCHCRTHSVPENAHKICTIADYVAMALTQRKEPLLHSSMAASLGCFDLIRKEWDKNACSKASLPLFLLPETTDDICPIGKDEKQREVCVAIGDNQASFLGTCDDPQHSVLINIGTGSQISFLTAPEKAPENMELRPFLNGSYLAVGSALCGGKAFALLERFLRQAANLVNDENVDRVYPAIDRFLNQCTALDTDLIVHTKFDGTRKNPELRGTIENIGIENFTPENLILGFMKGILQELFDFYQPAAENESSLILVGSGNGMQKNPALQKMCAAYFSLPFILSPYQEEAARGAAVSCSFLLKKP